MKTLREQLEEVYKEKEELKKEFDQTKTLLVSDKKEWMDMHNWVDKLKKELYFKDKEIEEKERIIKNMETANTKLKHQLRSADEERNRLKTWYIPRI